MSNEVISFSKLLENAYIFHFDLEQNCDVTLKFSILQNHVFQVIMHNRDVNALDRYWDTIHAILWPRFEHIVRLHARSVQDCNVQNFASIDVRPHFVSHNVCLHLLNIMMAYCRGDCDCVPFALINEKILKDGFFKPIKLFTN